MNGQSLEEIAKGIASALPSKSQDLVSQAPGPEDFSAQAGWDAFKGMIPGREAAPKIPHSNFKRLGSELASLFPDKTKMATQPTPENWRSPINLPIAPELSVRKLDEYEAEKKKFLEDMQTGRVQMPVLPATPVSEQRFGELEKPPEDWKPVGAVHNVLDQWKAQGAAAADAVFGGLTGANLGLEQKARAHIQKQRSEVPWEPIQRFTRVFGTILPSFAAMGMAGQVGSLAGKTLATVPKAAAAAKAAQAAAVGGEVLSATAAGEALIPGLGRVTIPALESATRAAVASTLVSLWENPEEGKKRWSNIPKNALLWGIMDGGIVTAEQAFEVLRGASYAKKMAAAGNLRFKKPPQVAESPFEVVVPMEGGGSFTFTKDQMYDLARKFRGSAEEIASLTAEERAVADLLTRENAWSEWIKASKAGRPATFSGGGRERVITGTAKEPVPETFRRPKMSDVFRGPQPDFVPAPPAAEGAAYYPEDVNIRRVPDKIEFGAPAEKPGTPTAPISQKPVIDATPKPGGGWTVTFELPPGPTAAAPPPTATPPAGGAGADLSGSGEPKEIVPTGIPAPEATGGRYAKRPGTSPVIPAPEGPARRPGEPLGALPAGERDVDVVRRDFRGAVASGMAASGKRFTPAQQREIDQVVENARPGELEFISNEIKSGRLKLVFFEGANDPVLARNGINIPKGAGGGKGISGGRVTFTPMAPGIAKHAPIVMVDLLQKRALGAAWFHEIFHQLYSSGQLAPEAKAEGVRYMHTTGDKVADRIIRRMDDPRDFDFSDPSLSPEDKVVEFYSLFADQALQAARQAGSNLIPVEVWGSMLANPPKEAYDLWRKANGLPIETALPPVMRGDMEQTAAFSIWHAVMRKLGLSTSGSNTQKRNIVKGLTERQAAELPHRPALGVEYDENELLAYLAQYDPIYREKFYDQFARRTWPEEPRGLPEGRPYRPMSRIPEPRSGVPIELGPGGTPAPAAGKVGPAPAAPKAEPGKLPEDFDPEFDPAPVFKSGVPVPAGFTKAGIRGFKDINTFGRQIQKALNAGWHVLFDSGNMGVNGWASLSGYVPGGKGRLLSTRSLGGMDPGAAGLQKLVTEIPKKVSAYIQSRPQGIQQKGGRKTRMPMIREIVNLGGVDLTETEKQHLMGEFEELRGISGFFRRKGAYFRGPGHLAEWAHEQGYIATENFEDLIDALAEENKQRFPHLYPDAKTLDEIEAEGLAGEPPPDYKFRLPDASDAANPEGVAYFQETGHRIPDLDEYLDVTGQDQPPFVLMKNNRYEYFALDRQGNLLWDEKSGDYFFDNENDASKAIFRHMTDWRRSGMRIPKETFGEDVVYNIKIDDLSDRDLKSFIEKELKHAFPGYQPRKRAQVGGPGRAAPEPEAGEPGAEAGGEPGEVSRPLGITGEPEPGGGLGGVGYTRRPPARVVDEDFIPKPPEHVKRGEYKGYPEDDQYLGINLILDRWKKGGPGFLLGDGPGFGKTVQFFGAMEHIRQNAKGKPILIVTQNKQIIDGNFEKDSRAMGIDKKNFEIGTYDGLRARKIGTQPHYAAVVFDEAHNLKNISSQKTIAGLGIKADYKVFATATPLDKPGAAVYFISEITGRSLREMMAQLGVDYTQYTGPDGKQHYAVKPLPGATWGQFHDKILAHRFLALQAGALVRREYPFFGDITQVNLKMPSSFAADQDKILEYWEKMIAKKGFGAAGVRVNELSRFSEISKVDPLFNLAKRELSNGRSVVIMAEFVNPTIIRGLEEIEMMGTQRQLMDKFKKEGFDLAYIFGPGDKTGAVALFQSDKVRVALMTPKSGAAGIDLDDQNGKYPRTLIVATRNFAGDVFDQALGRISRRKTKTPAQVIFADAHDSWSDQRRDKILTNKLTALRRIQAGEDPDTAYFMDYGAQDFDEKIKNLKEDEPGLFDDIDDLYEPKGPPRSVKAPAEEGAPSRKTEQGALFAPEEERPLGDEFPGGFDRRGLRIYKDINEARRLVQPLVDEGWNIKFGQTTERKAFAQIQGGRQEGKGKLTYSPLALKPEAFKPEVGQRSIDELAAEGQHTIDEIDKEIEADLEDDNRVNDIQAEPEKDFLPALTEEAAKVLKKLDVPSTLWSDIILDIFRSYDPAYPGGSLERFIKGRIKYHDKKGEKTLSTAQHERRDELDKQFAVIDPRLDVERKSSNVFEIEQLRGEVVRIINEAFPDDPEFAQIVNAHTMDGKTFQEIGAEMGVTGERARQKYHQAINAVRSDPAIKKMMDKDSIRTGFLAGFSQRDLDWFRDKYIELFTSIGHVPKDIDKWNDLRLGYRAAEIYEARMDLRSLRKMIKKLGDTPQLREEIYDLLGNKSQIQASRFSTPDKRLIRRIRDQIDKLSSMIIMWGNLPRGMENTFRAQMGHYLIRKYRAFEQESWRPDEQTWQDMKDWLRQRHPEIYGASANATVTVHGQQVPAFTDEEMDNVLEGILTTKRLAWKKLQSMYGRDKKKVPATSYIRRKELPEIYRRFLGEIRDPIYVATRTIINSATMSYNAMLIDYIKQIHGAGSSLQLWTDNKREALQKGWQHFNEPGMNAGSLRGTYISPYLYEYLTRDLVDARNAVADFIDKFYVSPYKAIRTLYNVPGHARNFIGNLLLAWLGGTFPAPWNFREWVDAAKIIHHGYVMKDGKNRAEMVKLFQSGVAEGTYYGTEIRTARQDLMAGDEELFVKRLAQAIEGNIPPKKLTEFVGDIYNAGDLIPKTAAFLIYTRKKGMSEFDAVAKINRIFQNYRKLPEFAKFLKQTSLLGPFVTFRLNMVKNLKNTFKRELETLMAGLGYGEPLETESGFGPSLGGGARTTTRQTPGGGTLAVKKRGPVDPKMAAKGAIGLIKLATVLALPMIISKVSEKAAGLSEDEVEALRGFMPKWRRNNAFVWFKFSGKLYAGDLTYVFPMYEIPVKIFKSLNKLMSGKEELGDFFNDINFAQVPLIDAYKIWIEGRYPGPEGRLFKETAEEGKTFEDLKRRSAEFLKNTYLPVSFPVTDVKNFLEGDWRNAASPQWRKMMDGLRDSELAMELFNFFGGTTLFHVDPKAQVEQYVQKEESKITALENKLDKWFEENPKASAADIKKKEAQTQGAIKTHEENLAKANLFMRKNKTLF